MISSIIGQNILISSISGRNKFILLYFFAKIMTLAWFYDHFYLKRFKMQFIKYWTSETLTKYSRYFCLL